MIEKEIKFLLTKDEMKELERRLTGMLEIKRKGRVYEKTSMLDDATGRMRSEDARLRVRECGDGVADCDTIEFSYKRRLGVERGIKKEEEIECGFMTDSEIFFGILSKIGYGVVGSYERLRTTYAARGLKVTFDEFPFGMILEIEGEEGDIERLCGELRLDATDSYPLSCDDVYRELCEAAGIAPKPHITFGDPDMPRYDGTQMPSRMNFTPTANKAMSTI